MSVFEQLDLTPQEMRVSDSLEAQTSPPGSPNLIDFPSSYLLAAMTPTELLDLFPELQALDDDAALSSSPFAVSSPLHSSAPATVPLQRLYPERWELFQSYSDEQLDWAIQQKHLSFASFSNDPSFWKQRLKRRHPDIYKFAKGKTVGSWKLLCSFVTVLSTDDEGYYKVYMSDLRELWACPLLLEYIFSRDVGLSEPFVHSMWNKQDRKLTTKMLENGFVPDNVEDLVDGWLMAYRFDLVEKMAKYGFYPNPELLSQFYWQAGMVPIFQTMLVYGVEPRSNNDVVAFWLGLGRHIIAYNIQTFAHATPVELPQFLYDAFKRCNDTAIVSKVCVRGVV